MAGRSCFGIARPTWGLSMRRKRNTPTYGGWPVVQCPTLDIVDFDRYGFARGKRRLGHGSPRFTIGPGARGITPACTGNIDLARPPTDLSSGVTGGHAAFRMALEPAPGGS